MMGDRQTERWPETGFGEIKAQAALRDTTSPQRGLLAREDASPS